MQAEQIDFADINFPDAPTPQGIWQVVWKQVSQPW